MWIWWGAGSKDGWRAGCLARSLMTWAGAADGFGTGVAGPSGRQVAQGGRSGSVQWGQYGVLAWRSKGFSRCSSARRRRWRPPGGQAVKAGSLCSDQAGRDQGVHEGRSSRTVDAECWASTSWVRGTAWNTAEQHWYPPGPRAGGPWRWWASLHVRPEHPRRRPAQIRLDMVEAAAGSAFAVVRHGASLAKTRGRAQKFGTE